MVDQRGRFIFWGLIKEVYLTLLEVGLRGRFNSLGGVDLTLLGVDQRGRFNPSWRLVKDVNLIFLGLINGVDLTFLEIAQRGRFSPRGQIIDLVS